MPAKPQTATVVIVVCFALGLAGRGATESFVTFVLPLSQEFGWDRGSVTSIYSITALAGALSAPLVGVLFDRFGPRQLYAMGLACVGLGLTLAAFADQLWQFYLCIGFGVGFGAAALGNVPHAALLSRWFRNRLSSASGIVYSSSGIGILLLVPLAQFLIDRSGWRNAYHWLGGGVLLLLPALLLLPWGRLAAGHPELAPVGGSAAGGVRGSAVLRAMRIPAFWGLFSVFFFTAFGNLSISVQAVPFLVDSGFPPLQAASAWGFTGMLTPLGMLGFGWLDERIGRRRSVGLSYALSLSAVVAMGLLSRYPSTWLLGLFILLMGTTLGSRGPLVSTLATSLFRGADLGAIYGSIMLGGGLGSAAGSFAGGLLHDWTHGYTVALVVSFVSLCLGGTPFWTVKALATDERHRG